MGSTANGETHPFLQLPHPGPVPNRAPPVWRGRQGHPPAFPGTEWRTCPVPPLPAPLVPSQDPPTCWQVQALPGHAEVPAGEVCRDLVGPGSLPSPGPPSHIRHQPDTVTRQASPHPALPSAHQQAQTHFPPRFYNQTADGSISAAPTYFMSYIYQTRHFFSPQKLPHLSFPRLHPPGPLQPCSTALSTGFGKVSGCTTTRRCWQRRLIATAFIPSSSSTRPAAGQAPTPGGSSSMPCGTWMGACGKWAPGESWCHPRGTWWGLKGIRAQPVPRQAVHGAGLPRGGVPPSLPCLGDNTVDLRGGHRTLRPPARCQRGQAGRTAWRGGDPGGVPHPLQH